MKSLEDEVQRLQDRPQAAPDAPGDSEESRTSLEALLAAVAAIVGLLVPVVREGWKRSHDNPAHKP